MNKTSNHYIKIPLVTLIFFVNCFCFLNLDFQLKENYCLNRALSKLKSNLGGSRNVSLNSFLSVANSH